MRIEIPEVKQLEGRQANTAKIAIDSNAHTFPDELWFSLRGDGEYQYPTLSDAFLIGMLPFAMKLGEPIRVEGPVSERLAHGLETYQSILNCWWPKIFKVVEIHYEALVDRRNEVRPVGVGCCFSGGVDAFYTVLKHLPEQQRLNAYQLTHTVKINGFDQTTGVEEESISTNFYNNYRRIMNKWGVKLLMVDTNLGIFRIASSVRRAVCYGTPLLASAHVLGNLFGRFIIPGYASYAHADLVRMPTHTMMDHLLGTDQLQVIHHAEGTIARKDKINFLADIPEVQQHLRVCFRDLEFDKETGNVTNCCECEKCMRTLITLTLLGKIEPFKAFPKRFDMKPHKFPEKLASSNMIFLAHNLRLARSVNNSEWISILEKAIRIKAKSKPNKQQRKGKNFKSIARAVINHIVPGN